MFGFIRAQNLALAQSEPWKLARRARESGDASERSALEARTAQIVGDAARGLLWASALLEPFLPDAAARIATALGTGAPAVYADVVPDWSGLGNNARTQRGDVLFERLAAGTP